MSHMLSLVHPILLAADADTAWPRAMLDAIVVVGIVLLSAGVLLCMVRMLKGPTLVDRGLAADTISIQIAGLVLLLTIRFETLVVFDVVLVVTILGFVSTLAFAQYLGRRGSAA